MKKPFGIIGGKSRLSKKLVSLLPKDYENMIYVEPFAGGASLYFKKNPSNKYEVLNELDKQTYTLLNGFKKYNGDKIRTDLISVPQNKTVFNKLKNINYKNQYQEFIKLLYLVKNSFFGQMNNYVKQEYQNPDFSKYKERMKNTIITNADYKTTKKYDSKNTLYYFDPPYLNSKRLYKHHEINYEELNEFLKSLTGKFLLTINYNPEFVKLFNSFNLYELETKYTPKLKTVGGIAQPIRELLVMNY